MCTSIFVKLQKIVFLEHLCSWIRQKYLFYVHEILLIEQNHPSGARMYSRNGDDSRDYSYAKNVLASRSFWHLTFDRSLSLLITNCKGTLIQISKSPYVWIYSKIMHWKFRIPNPNKSRVIYPGSLRFS